MTSEEKMNYRIDPGRMGELGETGIYVRALAPDGKAQSTDISRLDKESLLAWLRSRGGDNLWAENTVLLLLGHNPEVIEKRTGKWLIWSHEHGAWWMPDSSGYTRDFDKAGRYSFEQATLICEHANKYSNRIEETMLPELPK